MASATLSSKSQIVLPAVIRRKLGLHPGERLLVNVEGDHVVIRKAPISDVRALARYRSPVWSGYADALNDDRDQ